MMYLDTVIFDMDGLLIDSEPLWNEAANEVLHQYDIRLTAEQHEANTGLRTKECVESWFNHLNFSDEKLKSLEKEIIDRVLKKIGDKGTMLPGVHHIIRFFYERDFKIGLASSSPLSVIEPVMDLCGIKPFISAATSAEFLPYGKPHPMVYLNCAEALSSNPLQCICFEDSFYGLIAAKAARMKCVVVPHHQQQKLERWSIADLKLSSLQNFGELHLNMLQQRR